MSKATKPTDDSTDVQPYTETMVSEGTVYDTEKHRVIKYTNESDHPLSLNYHSESPCMSIWFDTVEIRSMGKDEVLELYLNFKRIDTHVATIKFSEISNNLKELLTQEFV